MKNSGIGNDEVGDPLIGIQFKEDVEKKTNKKME